MNDLAEIKEQLLDLVFSGKKEEAIKLLQGKYGADRAEAEKLLQLAIRENVTPAKLFSAVLKRASIHVAGGKGCRHTMFKYAAIICGFIGIPPLLIACGIYLYRDQQISESSIVAGIVTELKPYHSYGEPVEYTPIISYEVNNQNYTIEALVYGDTPEFEEGESVALYVHRDNPNVVIINTFTQKWFMVILIGSIGMVLTMGMFTLLLLSKPRQNTSYT